MKNILILGGLGFIGRNLVEELYNPLDYSLIVFDAPTAQAASGNVPAQFIFYGGDFNLESDLERVFKENAIDLVVHFISTTIPAGSTGAEIVYDIESNLVPTVKLLGLMRKYLVRKIVFASSGGTVYGLPLTNLSSRNIPETSETNPICSHGAVKLAIEKYICLSSYLYDVQYLILRISNPYGEHHSSLRQGLINVTLKKAINNQTLRIWGDGEIVRDYIYVKDCVKVIKQLIDKGASGEILNIGSGVGYSINEIVAIVQNVAGDFKVEREKARKFDVPRSVLDISKLKALVDFQPTDIHSGIKKTFDWIMKNRPA
ncbi:MAG: hypothetical protein A2270_07360 [Elusimicrobia bacterium RIFOXYA12_FULL_51_18]|nr:MAG: hypothetical protein A2270_07360 [Elusimicrobia bacterium RIFOXYA12_FULL_51_18]OGS28500.1 MAG: hypothetical protein A2218_05665 [Elusimicrobia bacterium RIFOXYA2_FULL_53_38]